MRSIPTALTYGYFLFPGLKMCLTVVHFLQARPTLPRGPVVIVFLVWGWGTAPKLVGTRLVVRNSPLIGLISFEGGPSRRGLSRPTI